MTEEEDYGPCCACGRTGRTVRNFLMLPKKAPIPGNGWGCLVCGLPPDGALAVVCDRCLRQNASIKFVVKGYVSDKQRVSVDTLPDELFEHHMELHSNEQ